MIAYYEENSRIIYLINLPFNLNRTTIPLLHVQNTNQCWNRKESVSYLFILWRVNVCWSFDCFCLFGLTESGQTLGQLVLLL